MADACAKLGLERGLIVHSQDGLDEISPCARTDCFWVRDGVVEPYCIDPKDYGVNVDSLGLKGGGVEDNVNIFWKILKNEGETGLASAVSLNAAAVLWVFGIVAELKQGMELVNEALANGKALDYFTNWLKYANGLKPHSDH